MTPNEHTEQSGRVELARSISIYSKGVRQWLPELERLAKADDDVRAAVCLKTLLNLSDRAAALLAADKPAESGEEAVEQAYQEGKAYAERYWSARIEPALQESASYREAYFKLLEQIANLKSLEPPSPIFLYTKPQADKVGGEAQPDALPDDVVKAAEKERARTEDLRCAVYDLSREANELRVALKVCVGALEYLKENANSEHYDEWCGQHASEALEKVAAIDAAMLKEGKV